MASRVESIKKRSRARTVSETVKDGVMLIPRFFGYYYMSSFFLKRGPKSPSSLKNTDFGFVVLCFGLVTSAFLGFLMYCGDERLIFLDEHIPQFGSVLNTVGSHGALSILVAFIVMLVLLPLPFRILGSLWVSFSTSDSSVAVPKKLLDDMIYAENHDDVKRMLGLLRDNNVQKCRNLMDEKMPVTRRDQSEEVTFQSTSWYSFISMQLLLASSALVICIMSDSLGSSASNSNNDHANGLSTFGAGMFSIVSLCLAMVATHGVGGRLRYGDFDFYQPFTGGAVFCTLQGISWTLFSMSVFLIGLQSFCSFVGYFQITCFRCLEQQILRQTTGSDSGAVLFSATTMGVVAEVLMIISLFAYRTKRRRTLEAETIRDTKFKNKTSKMASEPYHKRTPFRAVAVVTAWVLIFIKPEMIFFACFYSSMKLLPYLFGIDVVVIIAIWIALSCIYAYTYVGNPSGTGRREWPAFKRFIQNYVFDPLFEPYFGMRLIRDTAKAFNPNEKYIFGYHPHAIIPLAGGWCSHTSQWQNQLPGIRPSVLTSSILHSIPIARDVIQFTGGRDVSRPSFKNAVQTVGSVLLIPGGQREMIGSSSKSLEIRIDVKHKGFIRLGMEMGASLVPVFNFGGNRTFDNLPFPTSWQRWCMKALRANILFLPYGNWIFVPRTGPLTIVIGKPISKHVATPTEEQVKLVHRRYYTILHELFEKYKDDAGFSTSKMIFSGGKEPFQMIKESEFETRWIEACKKAKSQEPVVKNRRTTKPFMSEMVMATTIVLLLFVASLLLTYE